MKVTRVQHITNALVELEIGDEINKTEFIREHWGSVDYFIKRSFDVAYCTARKNLPERKFIAKYNIITRTS